MTKKSRGDSGFSSMEKPHSSQPFSENGAHRDPQLDGNDSGNESDVESQTEDQESHEPTKITDLFGYEDEDGLRTPHPEEDESVKKGFRERRERRRRGRALSKGGERERPKNPSRRLAVLAPAEDDSASETGVPLPRRGKRDSPVLAGDERVPETTQGNGRVKGGEFGVGSTSKSGSSEEANRGSTGSSPTVTVTTPSEPHEQGKVGVAVAAPTSPGVRFSTLGSPSGLLARTFSANGYSTTDEDRKGPVKTNRCRQVVKQIVQHRLFPSSLTFVLLFFLETVMTSNEWGVHLKTVLPYFMMSWCTIQITRFFRELYPGSAAPLYLSFVPFPLFIVFSREHHAHLSTLWLLLALNVHTRNMKLSKVHFKNVFLIHTLLYVVSVTFMSYYFIDTSEVDEFYGDVLSSPITPGSVLTSIFFSMVISRVMNAHIIFPQETHVPPEQPVPARQPPSPRSPKRPPPPAAAVPLLRQESSGSGLLSSSSSLGSLKYTIPFESLIFSEQDILGRGASGIVYKGTLDQEPVAIKKLLRDNISAKEVKILSSLSHKYIIGFKGISTRGEHDLYIVTEFVDNGSIYDYLEKLRKEKKSLPLSLIRKWSLQIAIGMDYLHTGAPQKILHRDLKSRNILLDSNLDVKIADFGWSRTTDELATAMTNTVGTCAWMAPEVIRGAKYTEMVDVWSYGVVLWELVTGQIPYDGLNFNAILFGVGREPPLLFLPIPKTCPPAVAAILEKCWQRDSTLRPPFKTIIKMFEETDVFLDTDPEFAQRQKDWRIEIARTMKSQERLMSSEVPTQDPRALLEQITAKEQVVLLKTEEMNQQAARLRRRELILLIVTGILSLLVIALALKFNWLRSIFLVK